MVYHPAPGCGRHVLHGAVLFSLLLCRPTSGHQGLTPWLRSPQAPTSGCQARAAGVPVPQRLGARHSARPVHHRHRVQVPLTRAATALAGILTVPAGPGPCPAVVLLAGLALEEHRAAAAGPPPFDALADYLTRRGVAVLRFADRGAVQADGALATSTSADYAAEYAADARAALAYLRARPEVDAARVGVLGHGEGGTAAIGAAGRADGAAFLVLLATPGLPGDEVEVQQAVAVLRQAHASPAQLARAEQRQRRIVRIVQQTPDDAQARAKLRPFLAQGPGSSPQARAFAERALAYFTSPAYRHRLADRPARTLPSVRCPVLALHGSADPLLAAGPNLAALAAALAAAGNARVTTRELPELNHLFQAGSTDNSAYSEHAPAFDPAALRIIADWVLSNEAG